MADKDTRFEDILSECLESVRSKRATVEECLARYHEQASELEPLLRTALAVGKASAVAPSAEFKARARYRFQEVIRAKAEKRPARRPIWQRGWAIGVAAVVAVVIMGSGTVAASASSLPDQPLYPVKMAKEQVQVLFARTPVARAKLNADLASTRVQEMEAMAAKGKVDQVDKLASQLDAQLAQVDKPANLSEAEAEAFRRHLEVQSVQQIDKLQKLQEVVPPQAKVAVGKAIQAAENRYENALQKAGAKPAQMEKIKGRWQSGPKKTPPGQMNKQTPALPGEIDAPTVTPSEQTGMATPAPSGQVTLPAQTLPSQMNAPTPTAPGKANGPKQTPPGQMSRPTQTPAGQPNGPRPTPPGQMHAPTSTPPGMPNGPKQTPPGQMNTPVPTLVGQTVVPTPTATPTPPGMPNGPKQTPPGQMKK